MTYDVIVNILKTERECVLRQDTPKCNRDCKNCNLHLPTESVLDAYDNVIALLQGIISYRDKCEDMKDDWNT